MIIESSNPGGFTTLSDVLVRAGYLYFRGTDNAVWRVNATSPADCTNFGGPGVVAAQSRVTYATSPTWPRTWAHREMPAT